MTGELSPASVYVSLLPVVEACVVVAVPGRVGEVRVAADEPEAVDLDPGVLARRLDAPKKFAFNRVSRVFAKEPQIPQIAINEPWEAPQEV